MGCNGVVVWRLARDIYRWRGKSCSLGGRISDPESVFLEGFFWIVVFFSFIEVIRLMFGFNCLLERL